MSGGNLGRELTDAEILIVQAIASLGTPGYSLVVNIAGDGVEWSAVSSGGVWGSITGTLSNQTDLQSALDDKADATDLTDHTGDTGNPHSVTAAQVGNDTAQWNADKLQGVTIDDTDIADGKILVYNSTSGNLEYETPSSGVTDHGLLSGLTDDDHTQYHTDARADTWLATKDSDDITEGATNLFLTSAEQTKLGYITVTQAVDLDQMESDIAALANGMVYKGDWDASVGSFPGSGSAQTGWFYNVSVGGTVDGVEFSAGDAVIATTDNASTSTYTGNWTKKDSTDAVQSVAGLVGTISASGLRSAINVEDGADVTDTTNVTAAGALMDSEVSSLSGIKTLTVPDSTTISTFGATLVDDTDAATARTTLGLGTIATQAASSVSITGGSITGITDLAIADGGTGASTAAGAFSNLKQAATTSATGVVELATTAEVNTGTDTSRAVTSDALAGSNLGIRYIQILVTAPDGDTSTGDGKVYVHIPAGLNGMNLIEVHAEVVTAPTGSAETYQIHNVTQAADMLSTALTIDATETGSDTAATPAVIDTANDDVSTNDVIRVDIDGVGSTTAAQGLILTMGFQLP